MGFEHEINLGGCDDAERLWAKLKGWHRGWEYEEPEEVAAELVLQGADAAKIIYRDVKAAVEVKYDYAGTVTDVSINVSSLGGEDNVPRIQEVLRRIGGEAAQKAITLLCLIDDIDDTGRSERVLGDAGTPEALHVLSHRLSFQSPTVAQSAAAALRRHQGGSATEDLPTLLATLTGRDAKAAVGAASGLGREGNAAAVGPLLGLLSRATLSRSKGVTVCGEEVTVLAAAAQALGRIGDRRALDPLVEAIGKYDEWTSEAAIVAVIALGGDPRAVVPTLQASLPAQSWPWTWAEGVVELGRAFDPRRSVTEDRKARLRAVGKMGSQAFEPLLAATENQKAEVRSLALCALSEAVAGENPEAVGLRERTVARAVACLTDGSDAVRLSAVQVLDCLDVPGRTDLLLPLLSDTGRNEHGRHMGYHVREAAADALPDGEATAERLRHALDGTPLADGSRLRASSVWSALTSGDSSRRKARWLDIVAPYVVREAEGDDEPWKAASVLAAPQIMEVLESVAPDKRRVAAKIVRKYRAEAEAKRIIWWRKGQPSPPRPPEQVRAAILVGFERLEEEVLEWLAWSDADLLALPLDMKEAWVEGLSAWKAALWSTDLWLPSTNHDPQEQPQEVHRAAPFRAAEHSYMKAHLSAEDYTWYLAGERVGTMKLKAQAAWEKGPLAWAAFLAPPRPKPAP